MRVMTFNIQHGLDYQNQRIDLSLFAKAIAGEGAEVCGLNEVRGKGANREYTDQLGAIAEDVGFHKYFAEAFKVGGENPYGNGLVSRYPFKGMETIPIPVPDDKNGTIYYEPRCILKAEIEKDGKTLCLLVCHMGLTREEQCEAVTTLCRLLDSLTLPIVLMGDFNMEPDDPTLCPLLERMEDSSAKATSSSLYTFPSYAPKQKIDYILYRGLSCRHAMTVERIMSDHFPIIADFDW